MNYKKEINLIWLCFLVLLIIIISNIYLETKIAIILSDRITILETETTIPAISHNIIIKEEKKEKVEGVKYKITDSERELISKLIVTESRGEPLEGKMAVAQVVLDRWLTTGGSIEEIIYAPNQFAEPYSGSTDEFPDCRLATSLVFDMGYRIFDTTTLYFFNPETSDPKAMAQIRQNSQYLDTIGNHEFRGSE